jgi:hypothetical protein
VNIIDVSNVQVVCSTTRVSVDESGVEIRLLRQGDNPSHIMPTR